MLFKFDKKSPLKSVKKKLYLLHKMIIVQGVKGRSMMMMQIWSVLLPSIPTKKILFLYTIYIFIMIFFIKLYEHSLI